jgi:hypothetical protein
LVDVISERPYCRISNLVDAGIAKRQTASEYLARLADIGILSPIQVGREKLFIHRALLDVLSPELAIRRSTKRIKSHEPSR